jgi:hypothetical protein
MGERNDSAAFTTFDFRQIDSARPSQSVQSETERRLIEFCLTRQMEKSHVTIQAAIDLMAQNGTQIN